MSLRGMDCCRERRGRNRDVLGTSRCLSYPLCLRFGFHVLGGYLFVALFAFLFLLQGCRTFCWCFSYGSMLTGEPIHTPINVLVVLGI